MHPSLPSPPFFFFPSRVPPRVLHSSPTRRSSDLPPGSAIGPRETIDLKKEAAPLTIPKSEEHTSELQSRVDLVCRLLLEKKKRMMDISLIGLEEQRAELDARAELASNR